MVHPGFSEVHDLWRATRGALSTGLVEPVFAFAGLARISSVEARVGCGGAGAPLVMELRAARPFRAATAVADARGRGLLMKSHAPVCAVSRAVRHHHRSTRRLVRSRPPSSSNPPPLARKHTPLQGSLSHAAPPVAPARRRRAHHPLPPPRDDHPPLLFTRRPHVERGARHRPRPSICPHRRSALRERCEAVP